MKFIVSGKNIDVTDALRDRVETKLSKLSKFFHDDTEAHVTLSVQKNEQIVEVTITYNGVIFRAEVSNEDMYNAIDKSVDVLERQILKNKTRLQKRFKDESFKFSDVSATYAQEDTDKYAIVKTKRFMVKPMTTDEAILQMNLLGHEFFMFKDFETNQVNVVYKRKDGDYGLLVPEE